MRIAILVGRARRSRTTNTAVQMSLRRLHSWQSLSRFWPKRSQVRRPSNHNPIITLQLLGQPRLAEDLGVHASVWITFIANSIVSADFI